MADRKASKPVEPVEIVPNVRDIPVDVLTVGATAGLDGPDGTDRIGIVQSVRSPRSGAFALVTYGPDIAQNVGTDRAVAVGSKSGTFGMYGTAGNTASAETAALTPGCVGHGKDGKPSIGGGFLYGFVGTVPADYGAIPSVGRWCETCTRAVRLDGGIIRVEPARTEPAAPAAE